MAAAAPMCAAVASPGTGTLRYLIQTVAGSGNVGDGGSASAAQLSQPQGIAMDRQGNLYIADTGNHRVRKVTPTGEISTVAGDGQPGMRGDGGPAVFARLNQPFGVAADTEGNIYIADLENHRVRCVDRDGAISTVAGTGTKGSRGDGGPAAEAQLMSPRSLALDASGNLYVSEFDGHRVRKITPQGIISTVAGLGVAGLAGDGGPAAKGQLSFPAGLAVDAAGVLYIADSQNHRIRRVREGVITTWLGGSDAVVLMTPVGLALDPAGNLYVAERIPAIRRFTPRGDVYRVAGTGTPGYDGDGRGATTSLLMDPAAVALDGMGNLYIADGLRIRTVRPTGIISTVAGDAYTRSIGDVGPATQAILNTPKGLGMDVTGNLYIADSGTHRIRKMDAGGVISTVAGLGSAGLAGNGRPASQAYLSAPAGVSPDGAGNLLVADTGNHRIRLIAPGGTIRTVAGSGGNGLGGDGVQATMMPLHGPMAALPGPDGKLYIADTLSSRILVVSAAGYITTAAGNASAGDSGDGGQAPQAQLREPSSLALDAGGNLYFADTLNQRIRKVDPAGVISTVAGCGKEGYAGDGGPAVDARLYNPRGVAVDGDGNLYIADTDNNVVRKVGTDGTIHTIAGTGAAGVDGDGGIATAAHLNGPWGLVLDGSGNLYVADSANHRVRRLTPAPDPDPVEVEEAVVLNAASFVPGVVAPGELVSIFGDNIRPETAATVSLDASGLASTELAGYQVLFDGTPAALLLVTHGQINAQVPYNVAGHGTTKIEVRQGKELRAQAAVQVGEAAPGIFTVSGGAGQVLAVNEDASHNSAANPAARGSVVTLYATGEGRTEPEGANGMPARAPYPKPVLPVKLTIGRYDAEILYAGAAPGMVGLMQINARLPAGFVPTGELAVELTVGVAASQPGVTIAVK